MNQINNQSVWMSWLMGVHVAYWSLHHAIQWYDVLLCMIPFQQMTYWMHTHTVFHLLCYVSRLERKMIVLKYCFWQLAHELQRLSNLHLPPGEDLSCPKTYAQYLISDFVLVIWLQRLNTNYNFPRLFSFLCHSTCIIQKFSLKTRRNKMPNNKRFGNNF